MQPERSIIDQAKLDEGVTLVRKYRYSIGKAARAAGLSYDKLRNYLNPAGTERRRERCRERFRERVAAGEIDRTKRHYVKSHIVERDKMIPGDILAERDKAMTEPRSLTAHLMGDPPFGRSALDRRAAE